MFTWKIFHEALPVGEQLLRRHISPDGKCKRCGNTESITHLFFECDFAIKVCDSVPISPALEIRGLIDLENVWTNLCERPCLPPTGISSGYLAPWVLWQLWTSRNILTFENREISAMETGTKAIIAAKEWGNCQVKQQQKTNSPAPPTDPAPRMRDHPLGCSLANRDYDGRTRLDDQFSKQNKLLLCPRTGRTLPAHCRRFGASGGSHDVQKIENPKTLLRIGLDATYTGGEFNLHTLGTLQYCGRHPLLFILF